MVLYCAQQLPKLIVILGKATLDNVMETLAVVIEEQFIHWLNNYVGSS